jgi:predicted permease
MGTLGQDIRYGWRMLARSPGFTALVVVILALGIAATTVMLSVVDAVTFRSCPYKDPSTLVYVCRNGYVDRKTGQIVRTADGSASMPILADWQTRNHVFESLGGAAQWGNLEVRIARKKEETTGVYVSPGFFSALRVQPILGRTFVPGEERPGTERVAILSYTHWQHWFAGDPNVIGKTLLVDKQVYTVVGVLPPDFRWLFRRFAPGLWLPTGPLDEKAGGRDNSGVIAIGRLKPGVSLSQARAEMDVITAQLAQEYPDTMRGVGATVMPLSAKAAAYILRAGKPRVLLMMLGVAASVLLIACLHIASLLIARSAERGREMVVRAALGAHRLRLIRQSLTESVLLAGLGGFSGAVLTYWALRVLSAVRGHSVPLFPTDIKNRFIPWFLDIRMDARSLLYVMAVSLLTCVVFGLLPALGVSKIHLNEALSEGRGQSQTRRFRHLRAGLVVLDIALAFVLLTGAGLMVNSYARLVNIDLQVNTKNVLVAETDIENTEDRYAQPHRRVALSRQMMERMSRLPGVQAVAVCSATPDWPGMSADKFTIEGLPPNADQMDIRRTSVSADFFPIFQIPVLKGRVFTVYDNEMSPPVAIISESLAQRLWPNEEPLGRHLIHGKTTPVAREIIGVVRDVKHWGNWPNGDNEVYIPESQDGGLDYPQVLVRTDGRTKGLPAAIRAEILALDPDVRISSVSLMEQRIRNLFSAQQTNALFLLSGFAVVAVLLAGIGVYGTIAYAVSRRTHEIGIRMALGARSHDVLRAVLQQGLTLTGIGLVLGLGGALAATRIIRSRLYQVTPTDPLTFVCVGLLLTSVALLACYLPARRAARIDPMVALRYE